ncbi:TetR/AcrR family transcriptional regulator [Knoellia koreensis]|uniref:TetR/AcrR family transcriptional regulator n=1 Tax=Knoellia koreensis TaxID=2730921 RepID=A0A849HMB3_9MICO|nr:TetR/AcrR family transcriptional regulator [Knoellia sp. DB2414S]NNM47803.1 TetR/AcrR family transcriptional regulator [Knoellia sp. DB2414S]
MKDGSVKGDGKKDGRTERWRAHRAERRREFVDAAIEAIRRDGPRLGLDDVCRVAGVSKPVVYRHFKDKDDLFAAVVQQIATDVFLPRMAAELMAASAADDRGVLGSIIRGYIATVREERDLYRFVFSHNEIGGDGDVVSSVESTIAEGVTELLRVRAAEPSDDLEYAAFALVGMVQLATHRWLERPTISEERLVEMLTGLAWDGLAPRAAATPEPQLSCVKRKT